MSIFFIPFHLPVLCVITVWLKTGAHFYPLKFQPVLLYFYCNLIHFATSFPLVFEPLSAVSAFYSHLLNYLIDQILVGCKLIYCNTYVIKKSFAIFINEFSSQGCRCDFWISSDF